MEGVIEPEVPCSIADQLTSGMENTIAACTGRCTPTVHLAACTNRKKRSAGAGSTTIYMLYTFNLTNSGDMNLADYKTNNTGVYCVCLCMIGVAGVSGPPRDRQETKVW